MAYIDTAAIIQVIGAIFMNNDLLDNNSYTFNEEDFPEEFHKILFGTIYNLHQLGNLKVTISAIEDYLSQRPKSYGIYKNNKGAEYLAELEKHTQIASFDYYYKRMKKMTLFRMYESIGLNLSWLYDTDNIFDTKKKQAQEDWLDNTPIESIAEIIDNKIIDIRLKYVDGADQESINAGTGALDLLQRLKTTPDIGYPLFGDLFTTVTGGARLKKFYLRSASTGVGKTRSMIADACYIACDELYSSQEGKWIKNGTKEPTIYISTEQEIDEIQTMMLAFISDVNEEHILNGEYLDGEWERVLYAADVLNRCPLFIQQLPDFSLKDIENTLKRGIHDHGVKYLFFDYLHSSMKILSEVTSKTGIKGLREDNVLFMISIRLKDMCNQYGVFIMTATQLNAGYTTAQEYDQNLLRGAKSIADKIDMGALMLETSAEDKEALKPLCEKGNFEIPIIKIAIYKNRRKKYKGILLWCKANRGTCKIIPMFATNYQYELIPIEETKITVEENLEFGA